MLLFYHFKTCGPLFYPLVHFFFFFWGVIFALTPSFTFFFFSLSFLF